jgi:hypothetical protein
MALTDVIDRLAEVNEEQLVETKDIRIEMESLTDRVTDLLELNKQDRLDRLESLREGAGAFEAPSLTGGDGGSGASGGGGKGILGGLASAFMGFFGLKAFLGSIAAFSGKLLKLFKGVGRFLGPIGLIITAIIATFATVEGFIKGYEEGGILGGLEGAVKGFFGAIVAAPLDLIREAAAWIAMQLGFSKVSTFLKSFSFAEIYDQLITTIFNVIENTVDFVKELFADPRAKLEELWTGLKNLLKINNLLDLFFLPTNLAVRWIQSIFNFGDPDKPFNLSTFIEGMIADTVALFTNIFQGLINKLRSIPILSEFFKSDEEKALDAEIKALNEQLKQQNKAADQMQFDATKSVFGPGYKLQRMGDPDRIAPVSGFFMSEEKKEELRDEKRVKAAKLKDELATFTSDQNLIELAKSVTEETIRKVEIQRQQIQTGMAVQQLNSAAGASGGGTTVVYQTTNNVSGGGGGGGATAVNAGSGSSAPSNDYHGTLDATQVIGGAPNR